MDKRDDKQIANVQSHAETWEKPTEIARRDTAAFILNQRSALNWTERLKQFFRLGSRPMPAESEINAFRTLFIEREERIEKAATALGCDVLAQKQLQGCEPIYKLLRSNSKAMILSPCERHEVARWITAEMEAVAIHRHLKCDSPSRKSRAL